MARKPSRKPAWQKEIVKERIKILFDQAQESNNKNPERSRRYIEMAEKISMRYNVRISPNLKRKYCKSCKNLLVSGKNSTTRASKTQKSVIITCKYCGQITRYPYRKEKSSQ